MYSPSLTPTFVIQQAGFQRNHYYLLAHLRPPLRSHLYSRPPCHPQDPSSHQPFPFPSLPLPHRRPLHCHPKTPLTPRHLRRISRSLRYTAPPVPGRDSGSTCRGAGKGGLWWRRCRFGLIAGSPRCCLSRIVGLRGLRLCLCRFAIKELDYLIGLLSGVEGWRRSEYPRELGW